MEIHVKAINCLRGQQVILRNISFKAVSGACIILCGNNGTGKTTLLRTLAGISPHQGGKLCIDFETIAYVGHANAMKSQLTVQENLTFWHQIYQASPLDKVIKILQLKTLAYRRVFTLSAGQKRRCALARIMLSDAKIWLLDEPTNFLDNQTATRIIKEILNHCASGGIVVIASHQNLAIAHAHILDVSRFAACSISVPHPADGDWNIIA